LVLEDGSEFHGKSFGKPRSTAGEVVFSTGMTGYPQSLTDPSFYGQILVSTYPLIGNYGIPFDKYDSWGLPVHFESDKVQVRGFAISELCEDPSHFGKIKTLSKWFEENDVPGIQGIDTRLLTKRLREQGVMRGKIVVDGDEEPSFDSGDIEHPVGVVSPHEPRLYQNPENGDEAPTIALIDCGAKANILRVLKSRGVNVLRVPWDYNLVGAEYDGVFISNGPGDPKSCGKTIATLRHLLDDERPMFGICLGNQLIGLAAGADTEKLLYGHRGQNQPCVESGSQRCYITSQNHGYAVRGDSIPPGWETWFTNGNDGSIEGIRSLERPISAVQFHPEGCPGPRDTEFLIDAFLTQVKARRKHHE
jgi:carbamoyl-phosphate synthase small subunit